MFVLLDPKIQLPPFSEFPITSNEYSILQFNKDFIEFVSSMKILFLKLQEIMSNEIVLFIIKISLIKFIKWLE